MKQGVKYNIEATKTNGEPRAPKNIAYKFVCQCRFLVKDKLPISLQEWKEPSKPCPDLTFVDDRAKKALWEDLMKHFTLPDHFTAVDVEKVKVAALRKMAVAFNNHKKTVWVAYVKGGKKTPEFTEHWRSKEITGQIS